MRSFYFYFVSSVDYGSVCCSGRAGRAIAAMGGGFGFGTMG
jgi:hypothetical protein